ncbi:MAG: hypothetical protein ACXVRS_11570 [Gaiellaceae bacterium]
MPPEGQRALEVAAPAKDVPAVERPPRPARAATKRDAPTTVRPPWAARALEAGVKIGSDRDAPSAASLAPAPSLGATLLPGLKKLRHDDPAALVSFLVYLRDRGQLWMLGSTTLVLRMSSPELRFPGTDQEVLHAFDAEFPMQMGGLPQPFPRSEPRYEKRGLWTSPLAITPQAEYEKPEFWAAEDPRRRGLKIVIGDQTHPTVSFPTAIARGVGDQGDRTVNLPPEYGWQMTPKALHAYLVYVAQRPLTAFEEKLVGGWKEKRVELLLDGSKLVGYFVGIEGLAYPVTGESPVAVPPDEPGLVHEDPIFDLLVGGRIAKPLGPALGRVVTAGGRLAGPVMTRLAAIAGRLAGPVTSRMASMARTFVLKLAFVVGKAESGLAEEPVFADVASVVTETTERRAVSTVASEGAAQSGGAAVTVAETTEAHFAEVGKQFGTTPARPSPGWTIPGTWRSAKPLAYRFIFGQSTLPDINRLRAIRMTLGHIVEKATGGRHSLENLMPQLNKVNVRLSGIYGRKPFAMPLPDGAWKRISVINGKRIEGSLREAFESGVFSYEEQRAISHWITGTVITPELEAELADLIRRIPKLAELAP